MSFAGKSEANIPKARPLVLVAGGSGGHLFPAIALAEYAHKNKVPVLLITDARGARFIEQDKDCFTHIEIVKTLKWSTICSLYVHLGRFYAHWNPVAIIGFGGSMTLVPLLTGWLRGIRRAIHQSDAIMGKANRLLSYCVNRVFLGHPLDVYLNKPSKKKRETWRAIGTPTRSAFQSIPVLKTISKPLQILILGGSQGAKIWSRIMPKAIALLSDDDRYALHMKHQCAPTDVQDVTQAYQKLNLFQYHVAPFFPDMPQALGWAHGVFSRAGASTLAELALSKRTVLLVPYPHAAQNHQWANAQAHVKQNPGQVCLESDLTPDYVATLLKSWLDKPEQLIYGEQKINSLEAPDACSQLYQFCTAP